MTLTIPANDHGAIYLFEVAGPTPPDLSKKADTALLAALGPALLNTDYVDVITPQMRADMTLPQLIETGYDMPVTDDLAATLKALTGTVILIMSAGFGGKDVTLTLPEGTAHITTLRETPSIQVTEPLTSAGAEGALDTPPVKPVKSNARMSGMVATYALLAMFALVALMIWVGG